MSFLTSIIPSWSGTYWSIMLLPSLEETTSAANIVRPSRIIGKRNRYMETVFFGTFLSALRYRPSVNWLARGE